MTFDTVSSSTTTTTRTPPPILKSRKRSSTTEKSNDPVTQPMKKLLIHNNYSGGSGISVCATDIQDRTRNLFPEHDGVLSIPCKSVRLFACFTLVAEQRDRGYYPEETTQRRESRRDRASKYVKPLLPLLSALVRVEKTSLGSDAAVKRAVHFSGFDCSSTPPPIDSLWGSIQHREAEIAALSEALGQVRLLLGNVENREEIVSCLQSMITFLSDMEKREGINLREECSRTMPSKWPSQRFEKAAQTYRSDFEKLAELISLASDSIVTRSSPLNIERHLAISLGQAIRFYLRAFFNPVPWKISPNNEVKPPIVKQSKLQSRVNELLVMTLPDGVVVKDTAIADGEISSVFSMALGVVFSYFGPDAFLSNEFRSPEAPDGFCTSDAFSRGRGTKKYPMTDEDVETVVSDIRTAARFRDAALACRFLSKLMNFPGVREEIVRVCGWGCIERHAKKILDYDLINWCPEDAHFILLSDTKRVFERIDAYTALLEDPVACCESRLNDVAKSFKCGPNPGFKRSRRGNQALTTIDSAMTRDFVFPDVVAQQQP